MLKRTLKKILQETTDKLNLILLENRQLKERLQVFENQNNEDLVDDLNSKINQLTTENEEIRLNCEMKYQKYEAEIEELEERNNSLSLELNQLKGEHFDTKRYADALEARLNNVNNTAGEYIENTAAEPAPMPELITAEEKDEVSFKYASAIISEAVIKTAAITSRLSASSDKNAAELKALAMGRCEMLKSDVLQTVMSDMIPEAKKSRMDTLLNETSEYLDSILGQLTI